MSRFARWLIWPTLLLVAGGTVWLWLDRLPVPATPVPGYDRLLTAGRGQAVSRWREQFRAEVTGLVDPPPGAYAMWSCVRVGWWERGRWVWVGEAPPWSRRRAFAWDKWLGRAPDHRQPPGVVTARNDAIFRHLAFALILDLAANLTAAGAMFLLLRRVIVHRLERRRRLCGLCVCGYDLRHSPDRCPECGRAAGA